MKRSWTRRILIGFLLYLAFGYGVGLWIKSKVEHPVVYIGQVSGPISHPLG